MAPRAGGSSGPGGALVAVYGARVPADGAIGSPLARALGSLGTGTVAFVELDPRATHALAHDDVLERRPRGAARRRGARRRRGDAEALPRGRPVLADVAPLLRRRDDGVWVLAPDGAHRGAPLVDAKAVTDLLDGLRGAVAMGVVDLERQVNERTLAGLDAADRILLVTNGSVSSLRATQRLLRLCRRLNYPDEKLCVVASPGDSPGALAPPEISAALRREVYWTISDAGRDCSALAARVLADLSESQR